MAKKELGKIGKGMKQTTLFDFISPKTHSENSKKYYQMKITDYLPRNNIIYSYETSETTKPLNRKDYFVINEEAWQRKVIENKAKRVFEGDFVLDSQFPAFETFETVEDNQPIDSETKELMLDYTYKMLEICLGKLLEEEKAKKVETETETIERIEIEETEIEVTEMETEIIEMEKVETIEIEEVKRNFLILLFIWFYLYNRYNKGEAGKLEKQLKGEMREVKAYNCRFQKKIDENRNSIKTCLSHITLIHTIPLKQSYQLTESYLSQSLLG